MKIDIELLKEFLDADDEFIVELIDKFEEEAAKLIDKITAKAEEKDWQSVKQAAHKMISSTAVFQLDKMTEVLKEIELEANSVVKEESIGAKVEQLTDYYLLTKIALNSAKQELIK